ncbi:hypothetical protein ACBR40_04675 [Nonomuraea sp. AD125B]|uniref:hypothetical protein n=1 Tax=Nonomuraea sp. AD125B TaxID=3242897 RepID=UPI003527A32A
MDPTEFCDSLREEMTSALARLNDALPSLDWVEISDRKAGAIKLTPIEAAPEPRNLRRIKNEVARRWSAVPLIDIFRGSMHTKDGPAARCTPGAESVGTSRHGNASRSVPPAISHPATVVREQVVFECTPRPTSRSRAHPLSTLMSRESIQRCV